MAERFDGLSDAGRKMLEDIFPVEKERDREMPAAYSSNILNLLLLFF